MTKYQKILNNLYDLEKFGIKLGLNNITNLLAKLNNPHLNLKCIHIAGTNGKGSVGSMIEAIFLSAGFKTGFYSSPHLIDFTERFKIKGINVDKKKIISLIEKVFSIVNKMDNIPTFFEFITAVAFKLFNDENVNPLILETGLGGRLDATNICNPICTVITNIGLEHQDYLGKTLSKIAFEKAGIIKNGIPLIHGVKQKKPREIIENIAKENNSEIFRKNKDVKIRKNSDTLFSLYSKKWKLKKISTNLIGKYQFDNACLALGVIEALNKNIFSITKEDFKKGLLSTNWPGRLELLKDIKIKKPKVWIDGAHNVHAMKTLIDNIKLIKNDKQLLILVLGIMADKNIKNMVKTIVNHVDYIICTRPEYKRAIDPNIIASFIPNNIKYEIILNLKDAILKSIKIANNNGVVLITGSLFTIGEVKKNIKNYLT